MGGVLGAIGGAGLGLIQHNQKKGEYNRQKELAAQQEALSPWTGVHGQMPKEVGSSLGSALQGGLSGATMGMGPLFGGGATPNPMAGAQQLGAQEGMSQFAQQPGMGMMAGGYEQPSKWAGLPTLMG